MAVENGENNADNEVSFTEGEVENKAENDRSQDQEAKRSENRRKSSSRDSKLAPGDHTLVQRLDRSWRKLKIGLTTQQQRELSFVKPLLCFHFRLF